MHLNPSLRFIEPGPLPSTLLRLPPAPQPAHPITLRRQVAIATAQWLRMVKGRRM